MSEKKAKEKEEKGEARNLRQRCLRATTFRGYAEERGKTNARKKKGNH